MGYMINRSENNRPINVALYGMDDRTCKVMTMFFHGPCQNIANVVDKFNAEVDIIDADFLNINNVLEERKRQSPDRPVIVLSVEKLLIEGTIYVKKPIQMVEIVSVLKQVRTELQKRRQHKLAVTTEAETRQKLEQKIAPPSVALGKNVTKRAGEKNIDLEEHKKTSKHLAATKLTEASFSLFTGTVIDGLNFADREQLGKASFNPKKFFLGYVQSAYQLARSKKRILLLNSGWRSLIILPDSHEIWLDVDDKQLKAFAGIKIKKSPDKKMTLTTFTHKANLLNEKMHGFYDMDVFIWKLAIWTSKGRYPDSININKPVYLKQWPNFTRMLITPHALRIAVLMISKPITAMDIADTLKIKPQYVFVFLSATNALDILGQAKRQEDVIITESEIMESKSKEFFNKLLGR